MKVLLKKSIFSISLVLLFVQAESQTLQFSDGDKVVMIGNSITHGGSYHTYLQLFYATRYPDTRVDFINCGISGDNASGMILRFEKDIMIHEPNYAFIMTGMNDVMHDLYGMESPDSTILVRREEALLNYYQNTSELAELLNDRGVKLIFMTPTIYDQTAKFESENKLGVNDALAKCAIHIRQLANEYKAPVVDLFAYLQTINTQLQLDDPNATIIGKDRVHPGQEGHLLMAMEIVKTIFPQSNILEVVLDAKRKTLLNEDFKTFDWIKTGDLLSFKLLEKSLPLPIPAHLDETFDMDPFDQEWNSELLKVTKLKKGSYRLSIDGKEIGSFTADQLNEGLDLAIIKHTPQYIQASELLKIAFKIQHLQSKLRVVKLVEYRHLRDYKGDGSLESRREFLDANNEQQKHRSWYPYLLRTVDQYFEFLPIEDQIIEELAQSRRALYNQNAPLIHTYSLAWQSK